MQFRKDSSPPNSDWQLENFVLNLVLLTVVISRVGWFSRALAFRSLYQPWGKISTTRSLEAPSLASAGESLFQASQFVEKNRFRPRESERRTFSFSLRSTGAPNHNFRENICSEDDLRSRIFGAFVVKFLACLPLLGFSNIYKMV